MSDHSTNGLAQAIEAVNRADFPTAIEILRELVVQDAGNAEAWKQLGVCYLEMRQACLAVEALTRSLDHSAADATTHFLLGHAYGSTGELESAAACYRHALELDPQHVRAEEFLIRAESLLESREHYRNGLKLLYSPDPTARDLSHALRELIYSAAIFDASPARDNLRECARKIVALRGQRVISFRTTPEIEPWMRACSRGYACIEAGNWAGARAAYDEALEYRAQDDFVHHALGFCFVELDEVADAVRAWLRVLELSPDYDFAVFGRVERVDAS
jgi:tetratricopeptide (TPR) repeat protein